MNPSENTKGPEILKWDCKRFPGKGVESTEVPLESPSSRYRYWIERSWNDNPDFILWIMFNPSHATIKCNRTISGRDGAVPICFGRSQRIAHYQDLSVGGMRIVNLFARRATDIHASEWPKGKPYDHPLWDAWIGPGDLNHIRDQAKAAKRVIAAWGFDKVKNEGAKWWADSIEAELSDLWCLRHPAGKSHPYYAGPQGKPPIDADIIRLEDARR